MFNMGTTEIFLIFLIILLLFGASRLPAIAKAMGKSINEFKKTKNDIINSIEETAKNEVKQEDSKNIDADCQKN